MRVLLKPQRVKNRKTVIITEEKWREEMKNKNYDKNVRKNA